MVVSVQAKMNIIWEAQHLIEAFSTPSQPGQASQSKNRKQRRRPNALRSLHSAIRYLSKHTQHRMNHNHTVTVLTEIRQVAHTLSQPARTVRSVTMAHQQVHPGHYDLLVHSS